MQGVVTNEMPRMRSMMQANMGMNGTKHEEKTFQVLDGRYFRRVGNYRGAMLRYWTWMFDFVVTIGAVDIELAGGIKDLTKYVSDPRNYLELETWEFNQGGMSEQMHKKYKGELFGLMVQLSDGEAKMVLTEMADKGDTPDGFKAILTYAKRFDNQQTGNLLQLLLDVASQGKPNNREVTQGIYKREAKVSALAGKHGEIVSTASR